MNYIKTFSALMIGVLVLAGCSSKSGKSDSAQAATPEAGAKAALPVRVAAISKTKISRTIDYTATVLPYYEVNVVPSTPGRIEKIFVQVGDRIKSGDDLFLMDRTQLFQQKVQLSSLAKDLARLDTLLKSGSAKQQQYDQLKTQYDVTKTNVDFMEQNTLLKSPFDGIVTGKYFENGEMYSGSPTTQTGRSAVVTVMQVNPLKINVSISEQYYPLIKKGMKAEVVADVYENEKFNATVYRVYPTINASTRSFTVELELQNRNDLLKPGMYVRVSMNLAEVETFVVPANTVLVEEGTNIRFVFIARDNTAERVEVEIGKRFDDKLEIISDKIKEGDKLVVEGQARLINGDKVEINK